MVGSKVQHVLFCPYFVLYSRKQSRREWSSSGMIETSLKSSSILHRFHSRNQIPFSGFFFFFRGVSSFCKQNWVPKYSGVERYRGSELSKANVFLPRFVHHATQCLIVGYIQLKLTRRSRNRYNGTPCQTATRPWLLRR